MNTSGLDFLDFVEDDDDESLLYAEYYQSNPGFTFTEDSVFSFNADSSIFVGYPYYISNDSLYFQLEFTNPIDTLSLDTALTDLFIGFGSASQLKIIQGFTQFCNVSTGQLTIISCSSNLSTKFYTQEFAFDQYGISAVEEIEEGDTLIVNNRFVIYE